jgi:hypothetical protein
MNAAEERETGKAKQIKPASRGIRLPKTWANAGAFSPLTPKSKLAQY